MKKAAYGRLSFSVQLTTKNQLLTTARKARYNQPFCLKYQYGAMPARIIINTAIG
jgi:hypothetical protein